MLASHLYHVPAAALSLQGLGSIAEVALAGIAVLALGGAAVQIHVTRSIARRSLAYAYADRFNDPSMIDRIIDFQEYWDQHDYAAWDKEARGTKQRLVIVPNLIEEFAAAYNRGLLDRKIAAMYLGSTVDILWESGMALVRGSQESVNPYAFVEWEEMLLDSNSRRGRARAKLDRRRKWRKRRQRVRERAYGPQPPSD
jgi:hypothetical protein